jgi:hypothetical protein
VAVAAAERGQTVEQSDFSHDITAAQECQKHLSTTASSDANRHLGTQTVKRAGLT